MHQEKEMCVKEEEEAHFSGIKEKMHNIPAESSQKTRRNLHTN